MQEPLLSEWLCALSPKLPGVVFDDTMPPKVSDVNPLNMLFFKVRCALLLILLLSIRFRLTGNVPKVGSGVKSSPHFWHLITDI